jgi:hypothetical protein
MICYKRAVEATGDTPEDPDNTDEQVASLDVR